MPNSIFLADAIDGRHQRRLTWAVRMAGEALNTALARDTSEQAVRLRAGLGDHPVHAFAQMIMEQADPTSNKRFTPWLMREYAAGRLILEDLGPANETLTLFQRYASRLKPEQRDIQRYDNLASAWQAVREFAERDEARSNRAQKALERAQAYAESRILRQDPDGFTVAVPLSEFAAKWWGRGTRWCTAAENNNQFWQYHQKAPLIVMTIPEVGKFQLWVHAKECQFTDAADKPVSTDLRYTMWPWVEALFVAALEKNGSVLRFIPAEYRTYDLCLAAVQQDGQALYWGPQEHRTYDLCMAAVRQDSRALQWVPQKHRTYDLCLAAVQQNGRALEWVPQQHQKHDLCLAAVKQDGAALAWVPQEHRTYDLCLAAVQQDGWALQWVPRAHQTYNLCLAAVQQSGMSLHSVPQEHRSYDLCLAAVQQSGMSLHSVPQEHRSHDLCLAAVQQNGWALYRVPEEHRTRDLYLAAVRQNGFALRWLPLEHKTHDLCLAAVQQYGGALDFVPKEQRTYDICIAAVRQNGRALEFVPEQDRTNDLCLAAVQQYGWALNWVSLKHQTGNLCLAAIKRDPAAIQLVPAHLRDELRARLPPTPEPTPSWDLDVLTFWSARLHTAPQTSLVRDA